MSDQEVKIKIEEALASAQAQLEKLGVESEYEIEKKYSEDEDLEYYLGILLVGKNVIDELDRLMFTIDADLNGSELADEEEFNETLSYFNEEISALCKVLEENEDKAAALLKYEETQDAEFDLEFQEIAKRLNAKTTANLKIAIFAAVAMIVIAAITIICNKLLG